MTEVFHELSDLLQEQRYKDCIERLREIESDPDLLTKLVSELLRVDDYETKFSICNNLYDYRKSLKVEMLIDPIIDCLRIDDEPVTDAVAFFLGASEDNSAVVDAVLRLVDDRDETSSGRAVANLLSHVPHAIERLSVTQVETLLKSDDPTTAGKTLLALAKRGDVYGVNHRFFATALTHPNLTVRRRALYAIGKAEVRSESITRELRGIIVDGKDEHNIDNALVAVGELGLVELMPAVVEYIGNENEYLSEAAAVSVELLGKGDSETVGRLAAFCTSAIDKLHLANSEDQKTVTSEVGALFASVNALVILKAKEPGLGKVFAFVLAVDENEPYLFGGFADTDFVLQTKLRILKGLKRQKPLVDALTVPLERLVESSNRRVAKAAAKLLGR